MCECVTATQSYFAPQRYDPQKSPIFRQKSSPNTQRNPVTTQKSPVFRQRTLYIYKRALEILTSMWRRRGRISQQPLPPLSATAAAQKSSVNVLKSSVNLQKGPMTLNAAPSSLIDDGSCAKELCKYVQKPNTQCFCTYLLKIIRLFCRISSLL